MDNVEDGTLSGSPAPAVPERDLVIVDQMRGIGPCTPQPTPNKLDHMQKPTSRTQQNVGVMLGWQRTNCMALKRC